MTRIGTYHQIADGLPILVRFDEEALPGDPLRPMCATVGYAFEELTSRGMPDAEEAAFVESLERTILAAARRDLLVQWVGRRTGHGRADLCFYAAANERLEVDFRAMLQRWPDRDLELSVLRDPQWEVFRQAFMPGAEEMLSSANLHGIEEEIVRGRDISKPCRVQHRAVFDRPADAQSYADARRADGQEVHAQDEQDLWIVVVVIEHDLLLATLEIQSRRLTRRAEACGGRYEGWQVEGLAP